MPLSAEQHNACVATVFEFFDALDTHSHDKARALFAEDGVWERGGAVLTGQAEIGAALDKRAPERKTFHMICNPVVESHDAQSATVRFYLMAYEAQPGQAAAPVGIRRCHDRLRLQGEVWRIAHKSSQAHLPLVPQ